MNRKQKKLISIAAICLILSAIIFYYNNIKIPKVIKRVENEVKRKIDVEAMPKRQVAVIIDKNGIDKYTTLTDEIIKNKIQVKEVPVPFIVEGAVSDFKFLKDKVTKEDLRYGEQIHYNSLSDKSNWYDDNDRLKEYRVKNLVADTVCEGNLVDVIINYENGDYDVVLSKTKVIKIVSPFDSESKEGSQDEGQEFDKNNPAKRTDEDMEFLVVFSVNSEEDYKNLNLASKLGYFETRKYVDEKQKASKKTFDYEWAIKKLGLKEITSKADTPLEKSEAEKESDGVDVTSKERSDDERIERER